MTQRNLWLLTLLICASGCQDDATSVTDPWSTRGPCLWIDQVAPALQPPAGLRLRFRALKCDGSALDEPLDDSAITVLNDLTGKPFGAGDEGGESFFLADSSLYSVYTVLALDLSDSIFEAGVDGTVLDAAKAFVEELLSGVADNHQVALLAFGSSANTVLAQGFTDNKAELLEALSALGGTRRGSTDLYGAYLAALTEVRSVEMDQNLILRTLVLVTDGTHEAGDTVVRHSQAVAARAAQPPVEIFTVGVEGAYDEAAVQELATDADHFVPVEDADTLLEALTELTNRLEAISDSNYVVGICTPVELGTGSVTLVVDTAEGRDAVTVLYETGALTGDLADCTAQAVANPCAGRECGVAYIGGPRCGEKDACGESQACRDGACEPDTEHVGAEMVTVNPLPDFTLGCDYAEQETWPCDDDELPTYTSDLVSLFFMDRTEVSVAQYRDCVLGGACELPGTGPGCTWGSFGPGADLPVTCVAREDARDYCAWAGKQLCEEIQWERAAKGEGDGPFPWGADPPECGIDAVLEDCAEGPMPVDICPDGASDDGILNLAGNVWEWTRTPYTPGAYAALKAGKDLPYGNEIVLRGGSFRSDAQRARVTNRLGMDRLDREVDVGIRCCDEPPGAGGAR